MFFFNTVQRVYPYQISEPVRSYGCGLDACFDCTCEIEILRNYLRSTGLKDPLDVAICKESHHITQSLSATRTLDVKPPSVFSTLAPL